MTMSVMHYALSCMLPADYSISFTPTRTLSSLQKDHGLVLSADW